MFTGASPSNPVPLLSHEMTWRESKKVPSSGVSIIHSRNNTICLLLLFRLFCRIGSSVYNHSLQSLFPLKSMVHATALILQNSLSVKSVTFRSNAALHQKVKSRVAFTSNLWEHVSIGSLCASTGARSLEAAVGILASTTTFCYFSTSNQLMVVIVISLGSMIAK